MLVCIIHQKDIKSAFEWARDAIEQVSTLIPDDINTTTLGSWSIKDLHDRNFREKLDDLPLYRDDQVNCNYLVTLIQREFVYSKKCGHVLYIVSKDMFLDEKTNYIVGGADEDRPAIVSTYRFSTPEFEYIINGMLEPNVSDQLKEFISRDEHKGKDPVDLMRIECTKTVVMHELGHVLGLVPETETENIEKRNTGTHCTNSCVMRGGLNGPEDWIEYTLNRSVQLGPDGIPPGPFCSRCLRILISKQKEELLKDACDKLEKIQSFREETDKIQLKNPPYTHTSTPPDVARHQREERHNELRYYIPEYRAQLSRILSDLVAIASSLPSGHELRDGFISNLDTCKIIVELEETETNSPDSLIDGFKCVEDDFKKVVNEFQSLLDEE